MRNSYLTYLGWLVLSVVAAVGFWATVPGHETGDLVLWALMTAPFVALGGLAGLALVAIIHRGCDLPPLVTGTSAYAGAVLIALCLVRWVAGSQ